MSVYIASNTQDIFKKTSHMTLADCNNDRTRVVYTDYYDIDVLYRLQALIHRVLSYM